MIGFDLETSVLVVGGGGCGLAASAFLSTLRVESLLVERHQGTSYLPKAHYLNTRSMEIFRQHDMASAIYELSTPQHNMVKARWCTSLAGDGPTDGRAIHDLDMFGSGSLKELYERDSAARVANVPQARLEPILRQLAEDRAPGRVRFHHELTDFAQDAEGVTATVTDRSSGEPLTVRARYVIAADGGKTIGPSLGVRMEGRENLMDVVTVHMRADLSPYVDDETLITWFLNASGKTGAMAKMGPTWDRHSEEWAVHLTYAPTDEARLDEEAMPDRVRELLGLPDLDLEVLHISHWILDRVVADRYRIDRVFMAGDAAHRRPPTTGLGLNTAIQDAHNLCWKLAAVIHGDAGDPLLDSYESERRPIGIANADWALLANSNHHLLDVAVGLAPGAPVKRNESALRLFFADTPMGETLRARAAISFETQAVEYQAYNVEIGFHYDDGALIGDSTPAPLRDPMGKTYVPSTRPGSRLPHAWLQWDGQPMSTLDLVAPDQWTLLCIGESQTWMDAAAELNIPLQVCALTAAVVGGGRWDEISQLDSGGALLVRPDQHIAWRSPRLPAEPAATLRAVVTELLMATEPVVTG